MNKFRSINFCSAPDDNVFTHFTRFDKFAPGPLHCTSANVIYFLYTQEHGRTKIITCSIFFRKMAQLFENMNVKYVGVKTRFSSDSRKILCELWFEKAFFWFFPNFLKNAIFFEVQSQAALFCVFSFKNHLFSPWNRNAKRSLN